jgi:hypothetical protein
MTDKIHSFGGRVEEVGATAIVATFGLDPVENPPAYAALAALAIQNAAERARRMYPLAPQVKIAIHAGQLMIDTVDGLAHIQLEDKSAVRNVLELLRERGQPGGIIVSKVAASFLERRFELTQQLQRAGGEPCYVLIGPERTGFGLGSRTLVPFVGRERELAIIADQLDQAEQGRGQIVAMLGGAGVGKSRLLYELTRADPVRGWRILTCRGFSYGLTTPSLPVAELLKSYFGVEDRDDIEDIRGKVSRSLWTLSSQFEALLSPLLSLLHVSVEDAQWKRLDPAQRRLRMMDACKQVLLRESQAQSLLLVFEDLHWIDSETQAFLDRLIDSLAGARVLLLVSYRVPTSVGCEVPLYSASDLSSKR